MAKIEDCPGFETFGADVKAAQKAKQLSRSALADMIPVSYTHLCTALTPFSFLSTIMVWSSGSSKPVWYFSSTTTSMCSSWPVSYTHLGTFYDG